MKIWIAGHRGMVGSATRRALIAAGHENIVVRGHEELELCDQAAVRRFLDSERPDYVFMAAGRVGGILANSMFPAAFLSDNLQMAVNIILQSAACGVRGLLYLGSSCMYPRDCAQPMREQDLFSGAFEPTNAGYGLAKATAARLVEAIGSNYENGAGYCCAVPCNLYGPGDNYDPARSHVLPALIRKASEALETGARSVSVWGSGVPLREFMHVDDLAKACVLMMEQRAAGIWNVGSGCEISIARLALECCWAAGYTGSIEFDRSKPDGMPRKLMDSSRIRSLGWEPRIALNEGLRRAVVDFAATRAIA